MTVLITGSSSGLGQALAQAYCQLGAQVFGLSRRKATISHDNYSHIICDLNNLESIGPKVSSLLEGIQQLDLVILNAGILAPFADMKDTSMATIDESMTINVWSNKSLLDEILADKKVSQVVAISSGASISGARGWNAYALSKASLNMLIKLYAAESPHTHFCSLAPGLIDTAMQEKISQSTQEETEKFSTIQRLKACKNTDSMPSPHLLAEQLVTLFPRLISICESGEYIDIRHI